MQLICFLRENVKYKSITKLKPKNFYLFFYLYKVKQRVSRYKKKVKKYGISGILLMTLDLF